MDLYEQLRYHRDTLAALESYGNGSGQRASTSRASLARVAAALPGEVAKLTAAADAARAAGRDSGADALEQKITALAQFLPDPVTGPSPSPRARRVTPKE